MQGQGNFEKVCSYHEQEVCAPCKVSYTGFTCSWEFIVCLKGDFDEWYKKECLYGDLLKGQDEYMVWMNKAFGKGLIMELCPFEF